MPILARVFPTSVLRSLFMLVVAFGVAGPVSATPGLLTMDDLRKIAPNARDEFLQAILDAEPQLDAAGINTRLRMAHFLAQVMTETGGLGRLDENMNYSFKTLMRVFSRKTISETKARQIAGKPVEIANWVYGARLGNLGRDTMDGWNYRGSGYIQLTGRSNFRARGSEIGIDLETDPEVARQAAEGLQAAIAYWNARNLNPAADDNDHHRVRLLVNGPAAHGEAQARIWFNRAWTRVFAAKEADGFEGGAVLPGGPVSEGALFDQILTESGLVSADELGNEAGGADARGAALRSFQAEVGLPETGELDEATQEALLDPREWRYQEDVIEASAQPTTGGDQSVSFDLATGSEEAAPAPRDPNEGTGVLAADIGLGAAEREFLDGARSIYPDYEMGALAGTAPESFKPFSVIGTDDRMAVTDTTTFPARAIVQILFESPRGRQLCSGAMISPDTVLTAAHCIHSGTLNGVPFTDYTVVPGRNQGAAPFGSCGVTRSFVLSGWATSPSVSEARYYDLGALKLDCRAGEATGWFGLTPLADTAAGMPIVIEGYAADLAPTGRQWRSEDQIRLLWDQKGFHQADTYGGTSGAPVAALDNPSVILGVHTNGLFGDEDPWAANNAFTRLTPERLAQIQSWIGGRE
ncbi:MAG: trypsin-like serine protease [Paracoccaceae bacterium]